MCYGIENKISDIKEIVDKILEKVEELWEDYQDRKLTQELENEDLETKEGE